ncbi:MAG: putative cell survival pathways protein [Vezdaea aestivalis]|nr:MAG: putative cell survival pathways protein [Vezdaea aestivalis]
MMNWAKQQLANVAGTQEPIYGPQAIQSVAKQAEKTPYTELTKEHLKWVAMESTCVETQTFYLMADSGHLAMVQVIYSNVAGIRTTCQFNTKVFYPDRKLPNLWSSDALSNHGFDADRVGFFADSVALDLSPEADSYTIKSVVNENSLVNLKITRIAPGFHVGEDGKSYFGTDPKNPWGSMRHAFWPRCQAEGTIITKDKELDFKGQAFFVHALQGMKPHHAAAKWNFMNFQSPSFSAVMMEYTTPSSYGSTIVNVGGLARDGEIITAGSLNSATHVEKNQDEETGWPEPVAVKYVWGGKTKDGKDISAVLEGPLGTRLDKVDVMEKVPGFVKTFVGGVVGTKPYIYQVIRPNATLEFLLTTEKYSPDPKLKLKVKIGDEEKEEEGIIFSESTFISE